MVERSPVSRALDDIGIAESTMDDYPVVHVLWQRGDLWMRPSDGLAATLLKLRRDPELFLIARDAADARWARCGRARPVSPPAAAA
jgi:hypothetical protein